MTKHGPRKAAIRAHMAAHGVNYTTAARALAAQPASRIEAFKAALATGNQDTINAALRAGAPGPDPWDLTYALVALARDDAALHEHTRDPETPVTADLLRLALAAEATHGHHRSGGPWWPTADTVCRAALLGLKATTGPDTPKIDGQHPVDPTDLAAILGALADDHPVLDEHATAHGFGPDYLAEALLLLAADLDKPTTPRPDPDTLTAHQRHWASRPHHHLVVTADPLTDADLATMSAADIADYHAAPDRTYTIECPGITDGGCEGWQECDQCWLLDEDQLEELEQTGTAHGLEHQHLSFGWATPTGICSLHGYPDAWMDSATDLDLPPGRYAVDHDWNDGCDLTLVTR